MLSIGQTLREERERQKRSLSEIASTTCISSLYLQGIEADDLSALPGYFFYKSFVKQYANALSIDYDSLEAGVARLAPAVEEDVLPALSANYQVPKRVVPSTTFSRHPLMWLSSFMLTVMLSCGAVYSWYHHKQDQAAEARIAGPLPAPVQVAAAKLPAKEPEPLHAAAVPVPVQPPQPDPQPGHNSVNIEAKEKAWISLKSQGKTVFRGVLAPSEIKEIQIAENASLTTGNAAALEVRFNGKPVGPLGARGQVRTVIFAQGIAQILNPNGGRL